MAKYLKEFSTLAEYSSYITSGNAFLPNVSLCSDTSGVYFNREAPAPVSDKLQATFEVVAGCVASLSFQTEYEGETLTFENLPYMMAIEGLFVFGYQSQEGFVMYAAQTRNPEVGDISRIIVDTEQYDIQGMGTVISTQSGGSEHYTIQVISLSDLSVEEYPIPALPLSDYFSSIKLNGQEVNFEDFQVETSLSLGVPVYTYQVDEVGQYVFEFTYNEGVSDIPIYSFTFLSELKALTIPSFINEIGEEPFLGLYGIITYNGTIEQWEGIRKEYNWDIGYMGEYIQCTDGRISMSYTLHYTTSDGEKINPVSFTPISNIYEGNEGTMVISKSESFSLLNCSTLETVTFEGTLSDFYCMDKDDKWAENTNLEYIQCSNGRANVVNYINYITNDGTALEIPQGSDKYISSTYEGGIGTLTFYYGLSFYTFSYGQKNKITSIILPENFIQFENSSVMFGNMENLTSLTVDSNNTVFDSRNNCNSVILTAENKLICGTSVSTIPSGITAIKEHAFAYCTFTSITIPEGITVIETNTFDGCDLRSLVIPEGVTTIEEYGLTQNYYLSALTIPSTLVYIGGKLLGWLDEHKICEVTYNGTMEQWAAIEKSDNCLYNVAILHCTDGDIVPNNESN